MKNLSLELVNQLKEKQEQIAVEVMPILAEKSYLQELLDPAMMPLIAASFMQNINNALETGNLLPLRATVDLLVQMAKNKGITDLATKNADFLDTVGAVVKKYASSQYHAELEQFIVELKNLFAEAYQG